MRMSYWSSDVCSSDLISTFALLKLEIKLILLLIPSANNRNRISIVATFATLEQFRLKPKHCCVLNLDELSKYNRLVLLFSLRSEEHTSELQSLMRISYAVFCLKKKNKTYNIT